ncbi:GDT1-like protein 3 [Seminavis robusta]|uniref:GDT1 family protein n=1 Tax=Seminavis robusta TaxID=568900 RepID=A0A9N8H997_9STRA|nr:GDT1-like protein 3 [Seminavis robusta]|eukprot:Sro247_g098090.1 GDT1-like protein 3 (337) ;mRNA; r:38790-39800
MACTTTTCTRLWLCLVLVLCYCYFPVMSQDTATAPARDVFDLLDANRDGRMDRAEFNQALDQFEDFLRHHPQTASKSWFHGSHTTDLPFWNGFTSAVAMIVATEIGDKTFFIAAVLSMKNDRRAIFGGAILALIVMTILSTVMGLVLPAFMDRKYTHLLAGVLFGYFGLRLLYESQSMAAHKVSEELEEVEGELLHTRNKKSEGDGIDGSIDNESSCPSGGDDTEGNSTDPERGMSKKRVKNKSRRQPWHMLVFQSFMLTFVAEWGDRSQIATIALAAAKNPYGVTIGGCLGHSLCTGLAVMGGRMLAARISEKTVSQWGGVLFLLFGIHSLFFES